MQDVTRDPLDEAPSGCGVLAGRQQEVRDLRLLAAHEPRRADAVATPLSRPRMLSAVRSAVRIARAEPSMTSTSPCSRHSPSSVRRVSTTSGSSVRNVSSAPSIPKITPGCFWMISARACARQAPGLVATLLASMEQEHERAAGAWHAEWAPLRALLVATG